MIQKMPEIEKSIIVHHILQKLYEISSRKTTQSHAAITISGLIGRFQNKYSFLKNVKIKDTRFLELEEPITVMSDIDSVESDNLSKALYDIIKATNRSLGEDAGHFFIKELRSNIDSDYHPIIEDMGLDLGLMQLEFEVNQMTKKLEEH